MQQTPSGLWLPQLAAKSYERDRAVSAPVMSEVATAADGRDITRGIIDSLPLLPPLDPTQRTGGGFPLDVYTDVLDDWQVFAALIQRRNAVIGLEWEVQPGGTRRRDRHAAELIETLLPAMGFDQATAGMHQGVYFGRSHGEIMWQRDGAQVVPERIIVRDARRFAWRPDGTPVLLTQAALDRGEPLPPRKFWQFSTSPFHDDDPYGMGLAHWCYPLVQFKRGNLKLWLIANDKFASPTAVGHFPPGTGEADRDRLLRALAAIRSQAALILPEGVTAELLAAARSGGGDFKEAVEYFDAGISKVILGHGAGLDTTPGRLGAEENAADVRADLVAADADLLCGSANQTWVRWTTEWSYPGAAIPRVWRRTAEEEDQETRAKVDKLVFDMGFKPTLKHVTDTYGGEYEAAAAPETPAAPADAAPLSSPPDNGRTDPDAPASAGENPRNFAAALVQLAGAPPDLLAALDSAATPAALQAAMEPLIRPILERAAREPEALLGALAEAYPAMDTTALEALLADLLYYAETAGIVLGEAERGAPDADPDPAPETAP